MDQATTVLKTHKTFLRQIDDRLGTCLGMSSLCNTLVVCDYSSGVDCNLFLFHRS